MYYILELMFESMCICPLKVAVLSVLHSAEKYLFCYLVKYIQAYTQSYLQTLLGWR